ncbi:MAG TPA: hypothetical protein VN549_02635 [Negativicutes bacterium]|nr:hypothetical protein [Negativicutes bacterium]
MPEVNINAVKDKYYDYSTFTGYGTGTTLLVGSKTSYNKGKYWANLAFDMSSIPANKKITAAQLYVYVSAISGLGNKNLYAMGADDFSETSDSIIASSFSLTNIVLGAQGQYYAIDITTIAQQGYSAGACYLALGAAENLDTVVTGDIPTYTINSRESSVNKPYVKITYEDLPPNPPTNLSPASETKLNSQGIRFSWAHNTTQSGDTQSKFDLQWSSNGGSTWNTVSQNSSNQYYDMPASTLPAGDIVWRVRTYSAAVLASEYSAQAAFVSAGKPNTPVVTKPISPANVSRLVIEWTSSGQVAFEAQVLMGANTVWGSGETTSTALNIQVAIDLQDDTAYTARVRIKNQYNIWSDWATRVFTVDFDSPNVPVMDITRDYGRGSIRIGISNPSPDGAGGFRYNEVLRRELDGEWIRIASGIGRDGTYEDCAPVSGKVYEYKARAIGTYGFADSIAKITDIKLKCSQLASISDTSLYVDLKYNAKRKICLVKEAASQKFAGRSKPVTEFGEHEDMIVALSATINNEEEYEKLLELVSSGQILLYRDHRARKLYCTTSTLDIDEGKKYWDVSFNITEESHIEEV